MRSNSVTMFLSNHELQKQMHDMSEVDETSMSDLDEYSSSSELVANLIPKYKNAPLCKLTKPKVHRRSQILPQKIYFEDEKYENTSGTVTEKPEQVICIEHEELLDELDSIPFTFKRPCK